MPASHFSVLLVIALALSTAVPAQKPVQETTPQATATPSEQSEVPDVPGLSGNLRGMNGGITISSLHDSITGWATLATPAVGYSFGDHFNIDITVPIYLYRLAQSRSSRPRANAQLVIQRAELGDVLFGLHTAFSPTYSGKQLFDYQLTGAFTAPTGDTSYGLSTGRVTFDVSNHFERTFGRLTPLVEIGMGDSSTLVNPLVTKNYTSLGPLAHFQLGFSVDIAHGISFETAAYEQLPVGDQKTYGPSRRGNATVVTGRNITEDNGFTNALDIPLTRRTTFSAYYNRSLRIHTDTAAVGLTYILRPAPTAETDRLGDLLR